MKAALIWIVLARVIFAQGSDSCTFNQLAGLTFATAFEVEYRYHVNQQPLCITPVYTNWPVCSTFLS